MAYFRNGLKIASFIVIATLIVTCDTVVKNQEQKVEQLETRIQFLTEENVPCKFMVMNRKNDSISLRIKFYEPGGAELSSRNLTLPGTEIVFDFISISVGDKYVAFPMRIFTDQVAPINGYEISELYNRLEFPAIFPNIPENVIHNQTLIELYAQIRHDSVPENNTFGNAVHDIKKLSLFEPGRLYRIVTRNRGGIEILDN